MDTFQKNKILEENKKMITSNNIASNRERAFFIITSFVITAMEILRKSSI